MAEKVKVSREVANVLDDIRTCHEPTIDNFIKRHASGECVNDFQELSNIRTLLVAHLVYTGDYEVEQTPEEKLVNHYKECVYSHTTDDQIYARGLKKAVDILSLEIKGINK